MDSSKDVFGDGDGKRRDLYVARNRRRYRLERVIRYGFSRSGVSREKEKSKGVKNNEEKNI